jgi:hypothetical protein
VSGEAAADLQAVGEGSAASAASMALSSAGGAASSPAGVAPRYGSTAAPPANSAQGKDLQGLAEAWGHVCGG